jgi:hypothetical protein
LCSMYLFPSLLCDKYFTYVFFFSSSPTLQSVSFLLLCNKLPQICWLQMTVSVAKSPAWPDWFSAQGLTKQQTGASWTVVSSLPLSFKSSSNVRCLPEMKAKVPNVPQVPVLSLGVSCSCAQLPEAACYSWHVIFSTA